MKHFRILGLVVLVGCTASLEAPLRPDAGGDNPDGALAPDAPSSSGDAPAASGDAAHDTPDALDNCSPLFAQDILPEYHLDISTEEWAKLEDEFLHTRERLAAGLDTTPYHPVGFHYEEGGQVGAQIPGVVVRLKGNSSWLAAIDFDPDPKMQFVIAFNQVDSNARFMGVRKVDLDMPRNDWSFLQQRIALFYLRGAGLEAQCASSARLVINGTYYGLYTNLERPDKEYLQRVFPGAAKGDLWKGGRVLQTNEDNFSWARLDAFWIAGNTGDVAALAALADLPAALREWSAEAMIGDADGYYTGHPNYFLYDHPTRGFVWLPDDLDTVADPAFLPADASPKFTVSLDRLEAEWVHFVAVMNDPIWFERYVAALSAARSRYDVAALQARVDAWSRQIEASAAADPHRPFTMDDHVQEVSVLRGFIADRAAYIDSWLACRTQGGVDQDGDGFDFCNDCNDANSSIHPGAAEVCNGVDDDCNGRTDDVAAPGTCS